MRKAEKLWGFVLVSLTVMTLTGCSLLGTTTADGDAKMPELGEYSGLKHAIGCVKFENQAGWKGSWEIGNNLAIMLESALFDTKRFVIVEREKLNYVIAEQDLAASGRTAKAKKVAQTGLIRPARYIGTGAITVVEEGASGGGGGISFAGVSVGGGGSKAAITIIAKLIDTTTGQVVAKKRILGRAGRAGLRVGVSHAGVSTGMNTFKKSPLGDAAQDCMNRAAVFFAKAMEEKPFEGSVVKTSADRVIINRGSEFGIAQGKEFVLREEGETLTDPDSGAILGKEEGKVLGKIKVAKVLPKMAYCTVLQGEKNPKAGTVVCEQ